MYAFALYYDTFLSFTDCTATAALLSEFVFLWTRSYFISPWIDHCRPCHIHANSIDNGIEKPATILLLFYARYIQIPPVIVVRRAYFKSQWFTLRLTTCPLADILTHSSVKAYCTRLEPDPSARRSLCLLFPYLIPFCCSPY